MKNFYFLLLLSFLIIPIHEGLYGQCGSPTGQVDLDVNNVSARVRTAGDLWWDGSAAQYVTPKNSNPVTTSLFAGSLWMAGFDPGGNIKMAAQTYGAPSGNNEYWPGPLDASNPVVTADLCNNWDKFFQITRQEISNHVFDWEDNGEINLIPADNILGWPARGNQYFFDIHGFDLPTSNQSLAPFWDEDQDNLYDPYAGDYPLVKGDQAIWWVMNDVGNVHGNSQGLPLTMEIQATAFSYKSEDAYIDNTTFYEYKLIYRGLEPLDSSFFSLWVDPDLGCWSDDYVECNVDAKMGFVYNGDDFDEDCSGLNGFQSEIPVLSIKVLDAFSSGNEDLPFSSFTYYYNANSGQGAGLTDPDFAPEYYNYMTGTWKDGTPFSQGGTGYNPPGGLPYPHAFDGSNIAGIPWRECLFDTDPADRRFLMNFGPATLQPGNIRNFAFAVLWNENQVYPCPNFDDIVAEGDLVQTFYDDKCQELLEGGEINNFNALAPAFDFQIVPNPMQTSTLISLDDALAPLYQVQLFSIDGTLAKEWNNLQIKQLEINRSELSSGLYLIKLQLADGQQAVRKLVIK